MRINWKRVALYVLTVDSFIKWIFFGGVLRKKSLKEIFFKMLLRKK